MVKATIKKGDIEITIDLTPEIERYHNSNILTQGYKDSEDKARQTLERIFKDVSGQIK